MVYGAKKKLTRVYGGKTVFNRKEVSFCEFNKISGRSLFQVYKLVSDEIISCQIPSKTYQIIKRNSLLQPHLSNVLGRSVFQNRAGSFSSKFESSNFRLIHDRFSRLWVEGISNIKVWQAAALSAFLFAG